jgi:hypothetical protein
MALIERNEAKVLRCEESFEFGDREGISPYHGLNQIDASTVVEVVRYHTSQRKMLILILLDLRNPIKELIFVRR